MKAIRERAALEAPERHVLRRNKALHIAEAVFAELEWRASARLAVTLLRKPVPLWVQTREWIQARAGASLERRTPYLDIFLDAEDWNLIRIANRRKPWEQ